MLILSVRAAAQCTSVITRQDSSAKCGVPVTLKVSSGFSMERIEWLLNGNPVAFRDAVWDTNGITVAGGNTPGAGANQLFTPIAVFVDKNAVVYISDYGNYRVQKWLPGAVAGTTVAGITGVTGNAANQFEHPYGIQVDPSGDIYVSDWRNHRVQKWAPGATNGVTVVGVTGMGAQALNRLNEATGLFLDATGNLYVAESINHRVTKWAPGATSGVVVAGTTGSPGAGLAQLNKPLSIWVDHDTVYIADTDNHRVVKWAPGAASGVVVAGSTGLPGNQPDRLNLPLGVTGDGLGNLYISESGTNNRVSKWARGATAGVLVAGQRGQGNAANQLYTPRDLYIDDTGNIYVPDWGNGRVQKFRPNIEDTFVAVAAGTYTAIVHGFNGCRDTAEFIVRPPFDARITFTGDTIFCRGDSVMLHAHPDSIGFTYQWQTAAGNINGAIRSSLAAYTGGIYRVAVRDSSKCADTSSYVTVKLLPLPEIDLGSDTGVCNTHLPFVLSSPQPAGARYLWSNGLSDTFMQVSQTGLYWVEVDLAGCKHRDSIRIKVIPAPVVNIGKDSIICAQFPLRIGMEIAGARYRWNTGAETPFIDVDSTYNYSLEVNLEGCVVSDTISLRAMPEPDIDLGGDRDICPDQTILLDATYGSNGKYFWNNGAETPIYEAVSAGTYWVKVISEYHCIGGDTVMLSYFPKPVISVPSDTSVCEETPLLIRPYQLNADSLLWSDGRIGDVLHITHGGMYVVTAVNKCGSVSDTVMISQIFCDIWLPNAFSPNGDGTNDVFRVLGNTSRLNGFSFSIFNRWGQQIFHTQDKYKGWDGKVRQQDAMAGSYIYLLMYNFEGVPYQKQGSFHLIR